VNQMARW